MKQKKYIDEQEVKKFLKLTVYDIEIQNEDETIQEMIDLAKLDKSPKSMSEFIEFVKEKYHPILFSTLFKGKQVGRLTDIKEDLNMRRPKIQYVQDKAKVFGRHSEMYDLLLFLSPDSDDDKIYCLNGLRESGSTVIALHCVQYAMERNDQIYGAYEIDAQNQFNTKGLISKIANKLGLVRDNED